ncbi:MAG: BlaI/MecI/CopY family transcriptional regulator [Oscillospiraceae bacterium]|nr:BlaI/MecI/CopY family transcriptional regulator [Oscillospiraceae bacterium]
MWEAESKITDAELEIMQALWAADGPMTLGQLKAALSDRHGWSGDTTKTLLRRLCEKGAVGQEKQKVYCYRPLVEQDQLGRYRTQRLIDKLYSGSAKAMVAALVEHDQLGPQDVDELRTFFQELWEKEGK